MGEDIDAFVAKGKEKAKLYKANAKAAAAAKKLGTEGVHVGPSGGCEPPEKRAIAVGVGETGGALRGLLIGAHARLDP